MIMEKTRPLVYPFPGLRPFEEDEEYFFFGRERPVTQLMSRLRSSRFLAVIGTSGSGKSSLIKAGVLPSIYRGFMAGAGSGWRVALFRPGDNPIGNLAAILAGRGVLGGDTGVGDTNIDDEADRDLIYGKLIEATLRRSNRGLIEVVRQARLPERENLLIVVDQFEELFRFSQLERDNSDEKRDSTAFINLLLESGRQTELPIYIIFTMRSDFLGDCTQFRGLPEAINSGQYLIPRMTRDEKRAAVEGPIAVCDASITQTLVSRLLNDVGDSPDHLPILQHALMRTWDYWAENRRDDEPLDLKHYEAIGTMKSALSQHAEEAYAELRSEKNRAICEKMFKLLTQRGETGRGVRRPAKVGEICAVANASEKEVIRVINVFRHPGRTFLMPPIEVRLHADSVIDISHESFMRIWDRLVQWVKEEEQSAELYRRLAQAAALHKEGKVGLWRNPELGLALKWREKNEPNAVWARQYDPSFDRAIAFLEISEKEQAREIKEKERKQKAEIKRNRFFTIVIGAIGIIAVFFAGWAIMSKKEVINLKRKAENERDTAKLARKDAVRLHNIANVQKNKALKEKKNADKSAEEAEKEREKAENSAKIAKQATIEAEKNQAKAEKEEQKAKENEVKAKIKGLIIDLNKADAIFRRYKAKAKELAVQSIAIVPDDDKAKELKVLLAITAYEADSEAYDQLASTTRRIFRKYAGKNLKQYQDNKELNEIKKKLETEYKQLRAQSKVRLQPPEIFEALREAYIASEESRDIIYDDAESWAMAAVAKNNILFNNRGGELLLASLKPDDSKLAVIKNIVPLSTDAISQVSAFAQTGDRLFCGTTAGTITCRQKNKWREKEKILPVDHGAKILAMAVSKKKNCLLYSVKNRIFMYPLNGKDKAESVIPFEEDNFIRTLAVVEDAENSILIAGDSKGSIFRSDLLIPGNVKKLEKIPINQNSNGFHAIAYNPAGKLLTLANSRGEIFLFTNVSPKNLKANIKIPSYTFEEKHEGIVRAVAFSSGGRYLASGGLDGTVRLWDLEGKNNADIPRLEPLLTITGGRKMKILSLVFDSREEYMVFSDEQRLHICPTRPEPFYNNLSKRKKRGYSENEMDQYFGEEMK